MGIALSMLAMLCIVLVTSNIATYKDLQRVNKKIEELEKEKAMYTFTPILDYRKFILNDIIAQIKVPYENQSFVNEDNIQHALFHEMAEMIIKHIDVESQKNIMTMETIYKGRLSIGRRVDK